MATYLSIVAIALLGTPGLGLVRIWRGPTPGDRMASVLLGGTTGVALLLILAAMKKSGAILDTALVLAVLAPVLVVAFVASRRRSPARESDHG